MTYEAKLDQLRSMGVVDMTLSFGCRIIQHQHIKKTSIYLGDTADEDSCMGSRYFYVYDIWHEIPYGESCNTYSDDFRFKNEKNKIYTILGHPLTYGKGRKRIKEHSPQLLEKFDELWIDWSTTLEYQPTKEEIVDLFLDNK